VIDRKRKTFALKAGGGKVSGESAFGDSTGTSPSFGIADVPGDAPSPDVIALMEEEFNELLARLKDDELQTIVGLKLEGYSNQDIAALRKCSIATIERRLKLIRACWTADNSP
jgi:DNA-directed RNA polymerase specialized sigma24 family protein